MFGIGGSKSDSKSTSAAQSTDYSSSFGQTTQNVFGADLFSMLYGDAMGATGKIAAGLPTFQGDAATLFGAGKDFISNLGGDAGSKYLTDRLSGPDDILNSQIEGLSGDLGKFFKETLLPQITSGGVMSGMLGGGREGVAQGAAAGEVARQFAQGVTALRSTNQAQKDAAAGTLMSGATTAAGVGLGALPGVLGLSEAGLTSTMLPTELLAKILGDKTTLTSSFDTSTSEGQSTATSKSRGKSGSFNFGFGD